MFILFIINLIALSPLFVKVWRMSQLLTAPRGFQRSNVKYIQTLLYTLPLIGIEILILLIFTIIDPPIQTETLGFGTGLGVQQVTCETKTNAFFIVQLIFDGMLFNNKTIVFICLFFKNLIIY